MDPTVLTYDLSTGEAEMGIPEAQWPVRVAELVSSRVSERPNLKKKKMDRN